MSARTRRVHAICPCGAATTFEPSSRADEVKIYDDLAKNPWKCCKCERTDKGELLSASTPQRSRTLVVTAKSYGHFWDGSSGIVYGPGFWAEARDFPPGTRLQVTATILPPIEDCPDANASR